MNIYYRLARQSRLLPTHWCYSEPWETEERHFQIDENTWEHETVVHDNRVKGFQVWCNLASLVAALAGRHVDGDYSAADYPYLISVEADDVSDGVGEWYSVNEFANPRQLRTAALLGWCVEQAASDVLSDLYKWVDDHEPQVRGWIAANSKPIKAIRRDVLPKRPKKTSR